MSILLACLVGAAAVTDQSLWIDEAQSATKAMQSSLPQWWTTMAQEKGSDLQMPFYMFWLWAWAKIFGTSEIALRAANLPWFVLGFLALLWIFPQDRQRRLAIGAITLTSAFLWYYLSEARSYIVLFAFSALVTACLLHLRANDASPSWFRLFLLGIVGMCATNLIAVPFAICAIAAAIFWMKPPSAFRFATRFQWSSALSLCFLTALALYYFWSLRSGARGSDVGRTGFANLAVAFYELLGLFGLGPGRLALREAGLKALSPYAGQMLLAVVVVLVLLLAGIETLRNKAKSRDFIFFGIATVLPVVLLLAAMIIGHSRLLGRHLTPLLPYLLVLLAIGFERMFFAGRPWFRIGALAAAVVLFLSALEIRFAPRHRRDDYRAAASLARTTLDAHGKVWWVADEHAGLYYKLPLDSPHLALSANLNEIQLEPVPPPDLVCYSKPDIYDPRGAIDNYLREHDFKVTRELPAFRVFQRRIPAR